MRLHELTPAPGSHRKRKRIGRGIAAGQGKTSGRGQKGQGSRSSVGLPVGFEGGQLRLSQRLPKLRGFHNKWRKEYAAVDLGKLRRFERDAVVDAAALADAGVIAKASLPVKILASGGISVPLTLRVHRISGAARTAVEAAGGTVDLLEERPEKKERRVRAKRPASDDADAGDSAEATSQATPAAAPASGDGTEGDGEPA
jgi:large subunit ribosomal protein L15